MPPADASAREADRTVGLDLEHEAVVVGRLLGASRLDLERHTPNRRVDRVDRDHTDGGAGLVLVGRDIAATVLDGQVDGEPALAVEAGDLESTVEHLDVGVGLNVGGRDLGGATSVETQGHRLIAVHHEDEVLEVEDDVGDVLSNTLDGVELVKGVVEAHLRHGCARDGRQQCAAQRIADGVAETRLEWPDGEALEVSLRLVDGFDSGSLDDEHRYLCYFE